MKKRISYNIWLKLLKKEWVNKLEEIQKPELYYIFCKMYCCINDNIKNILKQMEWFLI